MTHTCKICSFPSRSRLCWKVVSKESGSSGILSKCFCGGDKHLLDWSYGTNSIRSPCLWSCYVLQKRVAQRFDFCLGMYGTSPFAKINVMTVVNLAILQSVLWTNDCIILLTSHVEVSRGIPICVFLLGTTISGGFSGRSRSSYRDVCCLTYVQSLGLFAVSCAAMSNPDLFFPHPLLLCSLFACRIQCHFGLP